MSVRPRVSPALPRHWQAHVNALERSGLSRAEYCRRHDLSYHAMTYWQRKFRSTSHSLPSLVQVPAVCLEKTNATSPHRSSGVMIHAGNRFTVELSDHFSATTLARVLAVLEDR